MCPSIRKYNGTWARSDQEKCHVFAVYLKRVFQPNECHICENTFQNIHSMCSTQHLMFKWKAVKKVIIEQISY